MRDQPEPPGQQPEKRSLPKSTIAAMPADRRQIALVLVTERRRRVVRRCAPGSQRRRGCPSAWPRAPRRAPACRSAAQTSPDRRRRRSPDVRARSGRARPARGPRDPAARPAIAPAATPPRPPPRPRCARRCVRRPADAAASMSVTAAPVRTSTPSLSSCMRAFSDSDSGKRRQHPRPGFDQQHARVPRIDAAELVRQRVARDFGQRARQFDAGRAAADDGESQPAPRCGRDRRSASARSNAEQDAAPDRSASSSVFRPGACAAHSSWPK